MSPRRVTWNKFHTEGPRTLGATVKKFSRPGVCEPLPQPQVFSWQLCKPLGDVVLVCTYTQSKKNPSTWNFLSPELEVTWRTVAIIIRVVLLSPYLRMRGVSLSVIQWSLLYSHIEKDMLRPSWTWNGPSNAKKPNDGIKYYVRVK